MSPSHNLAFALLLGALGTSFAQKNDVLDAFAAQNRELEAKDASTPPRPIPSHYLDESKIASLSESDLAKLSQSDQLLKTAWVILISELPLSGFPPGDLSRDDPAVKDAGVRALIFFDLRRRGDTATATLLALARELEDTPFESALLESIGTLSSVQLAPFLEYSRNLLRTKPKSSKIVSAALLLGRHGIADDLLLLEQVASARPYFAETIRKEAQALKAHLEGERARVGSPTTKANPPQPVVQPPAPKKAPEAKPPTPSGDPTASTPWIIIVVLIVAATGLLGWLLKGRK